MSQLRDLRGTRRLDSTRKYSRSRRVHICKSGFCIYYLVVCVYIYRPSPHFRVWVNTDDDPNVGLDRARLCSLYVPMAIETLKDALAAGWRVRARCIDGQVDYTRSIAKCHYQAELSLETWSRRAVATCRWRASTIA